MEKVFTYMKNEGSLPVPIQGSVPQLIGHVDSEWNCQSWPSRSQNWMFVYFIIILSRSQQFPTSSSQNQVELGEWATGHFMHCVEAFCQECGILPRMWPLHCSGFVTNVQCFHFPKTFFPVFLSPWLDCVVHSPFKVKWLMKGYCCMAQIWFSY